MKIHNKAVLFREPVNGRVSDIYGLICAGWQSSGRFSPLVAMRWMLAT
jgi:hypothetical protein